MITGLFHRGNYFCIIDRKFKIEIIYPAELIKMENEFMLTSKYPCVATGNCKTGSIL